MKYLYLLVFCLLLSACNRNCSPPINIDDLQRISINVSLSELPVTQQSLVDYADFVTNHYMDGQWSIPDGNYYIMISGKGCFGCEVLQEYLATYVSQIPSEISANIIVYKGKSISKACQNWNVDSVPRLYRFVVKDNKWISKIEMPQNEIFKGGGLDKLAIRKFVQQ